MPIYSINCAITFGYINTKIFFVKLGLLPNKLTLAQSARKLTK